MKAWTHILLIAAVVAVTSACHAASQEAPETPAGRELPPPPVPAQAPDTASLPLLQNVEDKAQWEDFLDQLTVRNTTRPELYPVLPEPEKANGKAVIVVPGGGYYFVAVENEGFPVAQRLADEGYAAFVLNYRTRSTPADPEEFLTLMAQQFAGMGKRELPAYPPAIEDLQRAMTFVSRHCPDYGCTTGEVNLIGFSAGGLSVIKALETPPEDLEISSAALLYPPMTRPIHAAVTPPLFVAIASNDPLFQQGGFSLPEDWYGQTGRLEFHLYEGGGHGFGTLRKGSTAEDWLDQYVSWLSRR